jgi:predicted DNA-binding antitoxin AbrB/MazE fold protein
MKLTTEAVYENGVLRPTAALPGITEGQRVLLTVQPVSPSPVAGEALRRAALFQELEQEGMIEHLNPPGPARPLDWKPLVLEGEPLSETVVRMRREG